MNTVEKVKKLESALRDSRVRLENAKSDDAKAFYRKEITLRECNLAVLKARADYEGDKVLHAEMKKKERDEKAKIRNTARVQKLEAKLKGLYKSAFGVTIEIKTIATK